MSIQTLTLYKKYNCYRQLIMLLSLCYEFIKLYRGLGHIYVKLI